MSALADTSALLQRAAGEHPACLLFYSGGKESLAVAEMAHAHFKRVVGVFMYFVPGLELARARLEYARRRWGMECLLLPHWMISHFLRRGVYCVPRKVKEMNLVQTHEVARARSGVGLVVTGHRKGDGAHVGQLARAGGEGLLMPLRHWHKLDVLAYLRSAGIDAPAHNDLDLSTPSLLDLHDKHPEDFKRVCEVFPFAEAVVKRREWYAVSGRRKSS